MSKPAVIVDLDDTLIDTVTPLLAYATNFRQAEIDVPRREELTQDKLHQLYGDIRVALGQDRKYGIIADLPSGQLFDDAHEALEELHAIATVHIVTARDKRHSAEILTVLDQHAIGQWIDGIHYRPAASRTYEHKSAAAKAIGATVVFDDRLSTLEAMAGADVTGYLIDQPWNRVEVLPSHIVRTDSFSDAVKQFTRRIY